MLILPYVEQDPLYNAYKFDEPWNGPNNSKLGAKRPKNYAFPGADNADPITNYIAVVGEGTAWPTTGKVKDTDATDGQGSTILLVENLGAGIHWMEPRDLNFADLDFTLQNPQGISSKYGEPAIVTLDDTVYRLTKRLKPETLRALLTIRGGEKLEYNGGWQFLPDGRLRD